MKTVEARLKVSATDATGGVFKGLASKMDRVSRQAAEFNRRNTASARQQVQDFDRLNALYVKAMAAVSVGYVAKEAYTDFSGRERQLTRIAITAKATDVELNEARESVARLSKEFAAPPEKVVESLDTLIASGKSMREALDFLPDVVKTAQAANTEYADMAKTAGVLAGAMDITKEKMQAAFDVMLTQGKAGAFEMKDMAAELPTVANAYSVLGDKGMDGLVRLNAMLQTLREGTATSADAAVQAVNIFGKVNSQETRNKFKKMGIDLEKEMTSATKRGVAPIEAFTDITRKALKGNMNNLSLLFEDTQVKLGMTSLLDKPDSYKRFLAAGRDPGAQGAVDRDVKRILQDPQTGIDRMKASMDRAAQSFGKAVEEPVTAVLNTLSEATDMESAARAGLEKRGFTGWRKEWELINRLPIGTFPAAKDYEQIAREGGYVPADRPDLKNMQKRMPFAYNVLGRQPNRPISKTPEKFAMPDAFNYQNPLASFIDKQDAALSAASKASGDEIKGGGEEAGRALLDAGTQLARMITAAAADAARILNSVKVNVNTSGLVTKPTVNANVGRTDTFVRSPNTGHQ